MLWTWKAIESFMHTFMRAKLFLAKQHVCIDNGDFTMGSDDSLLDTLAISFYGDVGPGG